MSLVKPYLYSDAVASFNMSSDWLAIGLSVSHVDGLGVYIRRRSHDGDSRGINNPKPFQVAKLIINVVTEAVLAEINGKRRQKQVSATRRGR